MPLVSEASSGVRNPALPLPGGGPCCKEDRGARGARLAGRGPERSCSGVERQLNWAASCPCLVLQLPEDSASRERGLWRPQEGLPWPEGSVGSAGGFPAPPASPPPPSPLAFVPASPTLRPPGRGGGPGRGAPAASPPAGPAPSLLSGHWTGSTPTPTPPPAPPARPRPATSPPRAPPGGQNPRWRARRRRRRARGCRGNRQRPPQQGRPSASAGRGSGGSVWGDRRRRRGRAGGAGAARRPQHGGRLLELQQPVRHVLAAPVLQR